MKVKGLFGLVVVIVQLALGFVRFALAGTPALARYYRDQLVDHDDDNSNNKRHRRWVQRYYVWDKEFQGPGHAILCILGGEGNIEPKTGLLYPFVTHHLAKHFGAFVIQPEHRFYGESQPIPIPSPGNVNATIEYNHQLSKLFTPQQALQDAVRLIRHYQMQLGCSPNRTMSTYCPVITIGGSYPGWLSAMARLRFPDTVDMAYAASAPMLFYSQQVPSASYYNHITWVADRTVPNCARHVKLTLTMVQYILEELSNEDIHDIVVALGFCANSQPTYINTMSTLAQELFMIVAYTFANDNMANYPPSNETSLFQSCQTFLSTHWDPIQIVAQFMKQHFLVSPDSCIDMSAQLPTGFNATISAGDWSGVGTGLSGERWDFQTCTLLVEAIGFSDESMFPDRPWTLDWLQHHCWTRFQVEPEPRKLVDEWHFDDLVGSTNASHILFTNGLNDGWSVGGILQNLSDTLLSINFENGAHHSDLTGIGPSSRDTPDIVDGFATIQNILSTWLNEIEPRKNLYPLRTFRASIS